MPTQTPHEPASASAPRRVLITGFAPFDGADRNPSWDLAEQLATRAAAGELVAQSEAESSGAALELQTMLLPVEFETAGALLCTRLEELTRAGEMPEVVVALGLAGGTDAVALERVGINLRDARIPDNAGSQPVDEPVRAGGDGARFATLRLKAAHARIAAAGIPVRLSLSAGSFVCNDVLYTLMDHLSRTGADTRGGFVHVPDLHAAQTSVSLEQAMHAVDLLIAESLHAGPDTATPGGTLH